MRYTTPLCNDSAKQRGGRHSRASRTTRRELAHDLRTPLGGIIGLLDLIDPAGLTAEDHDRLLLARKTAETMLPMVDSMLAEPNASTCAADQVNQPFDPRALIRECVAIARAESGNAKHAFRIHAAGVLAQEVTGNALIARRIIANLLSNAVKFSPGGAIIVTARLRQRYDKAWLIVGVADQGRGIARNEWSTIFGNGTRIGAKEPGYGFGLAICKKLAAEANGRISVRSTPGRGSLFLLHLPVALAGATPAGHQPAQHQPAQHRPVLIVVPGRSRQIALQASLESSGLACVIASCPSEALDHICTAYSNGWRFGAALIDPDFCAEEYGPLANAIGILAGSGNHIPTFMMRPSRALPHLTSLGGRPLEGYLEPDAPQSVGHQIAQRLAQRV